MRPVFECGRSFMALCLALTLFLLAGCFGATKQQQRRYYTLHLVPSLGTPTPPRCLAGAAYVRDLNAESAYDKYQFVVRTSPFELAYRETQVWAVRPNRMLSDLLARALSDQRIFESVARELGSQRPDYIVGGDLQAIEIYDSGDLWFAHLAISLYATDFKTGDTIWTFAFDERKPVVVGDYSNAARALSELFSNAVERAATSIGTTAAGLDIAACALQTPPHEETATEPAEIAPPPAVIMLPEDARSQ